MNQSNKEDWKTVNSKRKMTHMASIFKGKFIAVPIAVSVKASTQAALRLLIPEAVFEMIEILLI